MRAGLLYVWRGLGRDTVRRPCRLVVYFHSRLPKYKAAAQNTTTATAEARASPLSPARRANIQNKPLTAAENTQPRNQTTVLLTPPPLSPARLVSPRT